jgi:hypothetical protein
MKQWQVRSRRDKDEADCKLWKRRFCGESPQLRPQANELPSVALQYWASKMAEVRAGNWEPPFNRTERFSGLEAKVVDKFGHEFSKEKRPHRHISRNLQDNDYMNIQNVGTTQIMEGCIRSEMAGQFRISVRR